MFDGARHVKGCPDLFVTLSFGENYRVINTISTQLLHVLCPEGLDSINQRAGRAAGEAAAKGEDHDSVQGGIVDIRLGRERPAVSQPSLVAPQVYKLQHAIVHSRSRDLIQEGRRHEVLQKPPVPLPLRVCLQKDVMIRSDTPQDIDKHFGPIKVLPAHQDVLRLSEVAHDQHRPSQGANEDLEQWCAQLGRLLK